MSPPEDMLTIQRTGNSPRNIIVFGESGVGKSSLINLIAGRSIAATSNDVGGCTLQHKRYYLPIDDTLYAIWDTAGLDEGTRGAVPAKIAKKKLKQLLRKLRKTHGIHLLLYCVRASRLRKTMLSNYNLFYSEICRGEVPIVAVVTGLEKHNGPMANWWMANETEFTTLNMRFDGHACVTTLNVDEANTPTLKQRRHESQQTARSMIATTCAPGRPVAEQAAWHESAPIVELYDLPLNPTASIKDVSPFEGGRLMDVGGNPFLVYRICDQHLHAGTQFKKKVAGRKADLLIICASILSDPSASRRAAAAFYRSYGGDKRPLLVVVKDAASDEGAREWWDRFDENVDGDERHRKHGRSEFRNLRASIYALPSPESLNAAAEIARLRRTIQSHEAEATSVGCFPLFIGWRPRSPKLYSAITEGGASSVAWDDCLTNANVWSPWRSQSRR